MKTHTLSINTALFYADLLCMDERLLTLQIM